MSRIGNRLINVPTEVNVVLSNNKVVLSSNNKSLEVNFNKHLVGVSYENNTLTTTRLNSSKESHMQQGTINALLTNAVIGLTKGFEKVLKIEGVGYRAALAGDKLNLSLGYSHPIVVNIPKDVAVVVPSPTEIKLSSFNKELLGELAANIRKWRKPEPYKGKGIAYANERIIRKVGKTSEGGKK